MWIERQDGWIDRQIKPAKEARDPIKMIDNSNFVNEMEFWAISVFFFALLNFPVILS